MKQSLHISRSPDDIFNDYLQIRFAIRDDNGGLRVAMPVVMQTVEDHCAPPAEPMLNICVKTQEDFLGNGLLQNLMDQLWAMGIRPRDIGTPGHLAATQAHLEDMRSLVAHAYNTTLCPKK